MYTFVGFDSAWADSIKAPGALCAVTVADGAPVRFHSPRLASFDQALDFIQEIGFDSKFLLIALDQPTAVPSMASMRPVERVAASLVSWLGGGVQPANRKPLGMFCDAAPIWKFLKTLDAIQDPEQARVAAEGRYLIEVFPSLALASIAPESFGRLKGLRYNPGRKKTFRVADWVAAASAATKAAQILGFDELAQWCAATARIAQPRKADQDMLDAALCLLIALRWRLGLRKDSLMLGDLASGYMVLPASPDVRAYLTMAAGKQSVPVDGALSENQIDVQVTLTAP